MKINQETIKIRVLEHDLQDNIRIGMSVEKLNTKDVIDKVAQFVEKRYSDKLDWCGGYPIGAEKYFKRIAIVNADTLEVIRLLFINKLKTKSE